MINEKPSFCLRFIQGSKIYNIKSEYHDFDQYCRIQDTKRNQSINQETHKIFTVKTLEWKKNYVSTSPDKDHAQ